MIEALIKVYPLALGLLLLVVANIAFGTAGAKISAKFNKETFAAGVLKGSAVTIGVTLVYISGYLNQSITFVIDGQTVTLLTAVNAAMVGAYGFYGVKAVGAFKSLVQIKTSQDTSSATESAQAAESEVIPATTDKQEGANVEGN